MCEKELVAKPWLRADIRVSAGHCINESFGVATTKVGAHGVASAIASKPKDSNGVAMQVKPWKTSSATANHTRKQQEKRGKS